MQNTDIFINPRQSVTFNNSIFHLEEKVTNYLFISHNKINKIASRADDVIKSSRAIYLSGIPDLKAGTQPPSCINLDNRLYIQ